MLEKLWNDIRLIYECSNFNKEFQIDNLIIISQDNYYHLHYAPDNKERVNIIIEKDYNLARIWGGDVPYDMVNYKIHVEIGGQIGGQIYTQENSKVELTYKIIKPFLREIKLNQIGV